MVIKFPLLKHESMGNGVVIKNNGHHIVEVGFSGDGIKNLTLDNPFITSCDISVLDFINDELYEYLFDDNAKKKAASYIYTHNISQLEIFPNKITGSVHGTHEYRFSIETKNSHILFECSCPVIGMCKHLYAACVYLKKNYAKVSERTLTPKEKKSKKLRPLLDNYLYYPIDITNFRILFQIYEFAKEDDNLEDFLVECFSYYNRNQYHNKIIDSLLYPLTFDGGFDGKFNDYLTNGNNENIQRMLKETYDYPNNISYQRNENNKSHRIKYDLLRMTFKEDIQYFLSLETPTDRDFQAIGYCLCELLTRKELSFEEIKAINESPIFQKASKVIYSVFVTYRNIIGHNGLLFIEQTKESDELLKTAPIDFVISKLFTSKNTIPFLSAINNRFYEIKQEDYDKIVESLVYTCLTTNISRHEEYESIIQLVDRFPDNKYLKQLVIYNAGYKPYWRY